MGVHTTLGFPSSFFWSNQGASYGSMWNPGHTGMSMLTSTLMGPVAWTGVAAGGFGAAMGGFGASSFGHSWGSHFNAMMGMTMSLFGSGRPVGYAMRPTQNSGVHGPRASRAAGPARANTPQQNEKVKDEKKPEPDPKPEPTPDPDPEPTPTPGTKKKSPWAKQALALRSSARGQLPSGVSKSLVYRAKRGADKKYTILISTKQWNKLDEAKQQEVQTKLNAWIKDANIAKLVSGIDWPGTSAPKPKGPPKTPPGGQVPPKPAQTLKQEVEAKILSMNGGAFKAKKFYNVSVSADGLKVTFTRKAAAKPEEEKLSQARVEAALKLQFPGKSIRAKINEK